MKVTLSLLALALAAFTSALPQPQGVDEEPIPEYGGIGRRGGNGDPYAPHSVFRSDPYSQHDEDDGDWRKEDSEMAKRSPVAHGDKWDEKTGDDNPAYNPNDPTTYSQEWWDSIGSDNPKKRSPGNDGSRGNLGGDNPNEKRDDNPTDNVNVPTTYSQDWWATTGSDNP